MTQHRGGRNTKLRICNKCLECSVSLINTAHMCQDTFERGNCYYWLRVYSFKALAKSAMEKRRSNPRDTDKDVRNALAPFRLTLFNLARKEQTTIPLTVCSFKQCLETVSFHQPPYPSTPSHGNTLKIVYSKLHFFYIVSF